jgi:ABC-2 type transport system ATP-binding protein
MSPAPVLTLRDVTIRFGHTLALAGLSLEVRRGEIFGLLGPNGSGKSSTISAIAGALTPQAGRIEVLGCQEPSHPLEYRRHIGLVPQELALYEDLSAEDNLIFFGRLYGLSGQLLHRRVADVLEMVCLGEQARGMVRTWSGGMQRRLNLACALLHEPALLLLDEPTVGIDLPSRQAIFGSLRALRAAGRALVFTTHHLEEAEQLCDRLGIMDRGRLLAVGTVAELCSAPRMGLEQVFLELTGRSLHEG